MLGLPMEMLERVLIGKVTDDSISQEEDDNGA
jgi:hypothetical protein